MAFNTNGASTAGPKGLFSTDPLDVRLQVKLKSDLNDIKAGSVYESIRVFCQEDKKFYTPKNFDTTAPTANVEWQEVTEGGGSLPDELKDATYDKGGMKILDFALVPRAQEIASSINYDGDDRYAYIDTMQDSSRYRMFTSDYICTKPFVALDSYADEDFEEPVTTYLMVSPEDAAGLGMEANTWYKVTGYDSRLAYDTWEKADYNEVYNTYKSWKSRDNWTVRYAEFVAILDKTILHSPVDTTLEDAIDTKQNVLKAGEGIVIDNGTNSISVDFPDEYRSVTYKKASVDFSNSAMHTPGSIATFSKEEEIDVDHTRETTYTFDRTTAKALTGVGSTTTNYRNVIRIIKDISIFDLTIFDYSEWDCEVYFLATEPTISTAGWEIKENTWYKCKTEADYVVDMTKAVEVPSSEVLELMNSVEWTVSSSRRTDYEYLMDVMFSMTLENKFDSVSDRIDSVEENTKRLLFYGYSAASDITTYKVLINIDSDVPPTLTDGLTLVWTVEKEIKRDTYIQLQGSTTQKRLIVSRHEDWDLIDEQGSYGSQYALYKNSCVIAAGTTVVITYSGSVWRISDYDERQTLNTLYDARGETVAIYTETAETTPTLYPFKILAETQDGRYACLTYDQSVDHRWSQIQPIHFPLSNIKYKFGTRFLYYFRNEARPLTPYITNPVAYPELSDMDYIDHGYVPLMHTFTWAGGDNGHIFAYNGQVIRRSTTISGTIGQTPETIYLRVVDNGDGTWSLDGDERNGIQNNVSLGLPSEDDGYVYIALAKLIVNNGPSDIGQIYNSYYLLKDHPTYRWCGDHWGLGGSAGGQLPDDFTNVKYTSKEAEIDWSNPAWHDGDRTIYEENPGYFMTLTTYEVVTGNEDNNGACVAIYDLDEVLDYVMFAPDSIPLNGFPDVKAGVWYKATDYDDDGLYAGLEEVGIAEPIALFNSIKARGGYIVDRDLYDYFVAEVLTEKALVDVTFGEKFAESEVKVKALLDATETVLESNTIYNGGKLGDIDISLPASLDVTYISQVHFSTPEEDAPSFVYDERINFFGDDCEDGVFTPIEWARYSIMIFFDGENPIGMVMRI